MSKKIIFKCDVCGKEEEGVELPKGWIKLEALRIEKEGQIWSKPMPESHFCKAECLIEWIKKILTLRS
jgi:hypothetical protein